MFTTKKSKDPYLATWSQSNFEHLILANFDNKQKITNENVPTVCKFAKALKTNIQAIIKGMWGPKISQCHAQEL